MTQPTTPMLTCQCWIRWRCKILNRTICKNYNNWFVLVCSPFFSALHVTHPCCRFSVHIIGRSVKILFDKPVNDFWQLCNGWCILLVRVLIIVFNIYRSVAVTSADRRIGKCVWREICIFFFGFRPMAVAFHHCRWMRPISHISICSWSDWINKWPNYIPV